jgi:cysteine-rich repeat protein
MRALMLVLLLGACTDGGDDDPSQRTDEIEAEDGEDAECGDGEHPDAPTGDPACGNGIVEPGEVCDDGNNVNGDGCSNQCNSVEVCGNGYLDAGETCDDGNTVGGDGCSADCRSIEACGNAIVDVQSGEQCDDGNTVDDDGCTNTCQIE